MITSHLCSEAKPSGAQSHQARTPVLGTPSSPGAQKGWASGRGNHSQLPSYPHLRLFQSFLFVPGWMMYLTYKYHLLKGDLQNNTTPPPPYLSSGIKYTTAVHQLCTNLNILTMFIIIHSFPILLF